MPDQGLTDGTIIRLGDLVAVRIKNGRYRLSFQLFTLFHDSSSIISILGNAKGIAKYSQSKSCFSCTVWHGDYDDI